MVFGVETGREVQGRRGSQFRLIKDATSAGASIPWGNEAEIFIIAISEGRKHV